jgi:hypothetical protein
MSMKNLHRIVLVALVAACFFYATSCNTQDLAPEQQVAVADAEGDVEAADLAVDQAFAAAEAARETPELEDDAQADAALTEALAERDAANRALNETLTRGVTDAATPWIDLVTSFLGPAGRAAGAGAKGLLGLLPLSLFFERPRRHLKQMVTRDLNPFVGGTVDWRNAMLNFGRAYGLAHSSEASKAAAAEKAPTA